MGEKPAKEADDLPEKARSGTNERAVRDTCHEVGPPTASADLRCSAPCRTTAPLRPPSRARRRSRELGRPEGAAARAGIADILPCTSRITRSPTRTSRARSPRASTARAPWRSGIEAPTSWSRRSATAASRLCSTAHALEGTWTLVPAAMDGDPKNWLLLRKRDDAPAPEERPHCAMRQCSPRLRKRCRRATAGSTR